MLGFWGLGFAVAIPLPGMKIPATVRIKGSQHNNLHRLLSPDRREEGRTYSYQPHNDSKSPNSSLTHYVPPDPLNEIGYMYICSIDI